ncbi:MAG: metallophosphoesterase [Bacteroidota bacterium]
MSFRVLFPIFFILVIIGLDFYVIKGLRSTFRVGWPLRIALIVEWTSILVTAVTFVGIIMTFSGIITRQNAFTNLLTGLTLTFFVTKLTFAVFLFGEDLVRGVVWVGQQIAALFRSDGEAVSLASRRKFVGQIGLVVAAIPFSGFFYGFVRGIYDFKVHRMRLAFPDLPPAFAGFRIVQISDIHSGSFANGNVLEKGARIIMEQDPDLILFTGDMVNNIAPEIEPYLDILAGLSGKYGKYAVLGNHDYGVYRSWSSPEAKAANLEKLKGHHKTMGFDLLNNENRVIEKEGQRIRLVGVENWGDPPFPQHGDLDRALEGVAEDEFVVLMSHDPTHWDAKVRPGAKQVHLTLSGHTHGAQIGVEIPGFRFSPVQLRYSRWAGLYEEADEKLYVNRGFGFIGYPGRIGIWPEITVIELARA